MSFDEKKLYELLPAIYRIRDTEKGEPLKELLSIISEQVEVLEENLEQLYDDQFIETCAEWVIPYIGDLIGYRPLHGVAPSISSPRAEVTNTITYRRRKGTAAMLEQLARDVTGWDARVIEFFKLLAATQYMNHIRPENLQTPDLRRWEPLERLDTPFDSLAHTADVRSIASRRGRFNIPNVGIYLFRLYPFSLTSSPAFKLKDRCYFFSPLGNNMQLFTRPETEEEITHLAEPINVPMPISRRVLKEYIDDFYGKDKSLSLNVEGNDITRDQILVCDLSDAGSSWAHMPKDKFAIDPLLGRIALPEDLPSNPGVYVSFHYGFSMDIGGGEYERGASFILFESVRKVPDDFPTIQDALVDLSGNGVVEITRNGIYRESLEINASKSQKIELRAVNGCRPTLVIVDESLPEGEVPAFKIRGADDAEVTLNGLIVTGGMLRVNGIGRFNMRHCTLVPGLVLGTDGTPKSPSEPSLIIESPDTVVEIDLSILGGLRVVDATVQINSSIVDAMDESNVAYASIDGSKAGGELNIKNSTVIGKVHTILMMLASNTIFMARLAIGDQWAAPVLSERKQEGCVRFSYLPLEARVPRRYYCQPATQEDPARLLPQFTSLSYGDAGYCQLSQNCAQEIQKGADDEAEMGVFHDLFQPQRITNLRVRLDEYLRFSLEAGIFYVDQKIYDKNSGGL